MRRFIILGLAALIFFPPFVAGINFAQPTGEGFSWLSPSWFIFSLSCTIFQAGVFCLLLLHLINSGLRGQPAWHRTPLDVPLLLFFLFFLFSLFNSVNLNESLKITYQFLAYAGLFYLTLNCLREKREIKFLFGVVILAAVLIAGYGLWQYFFLFERLKEEVLSSPAFLPHALELLKRLEGKRVYSTFVYPPALGGYLILVFPLAVGFFHSVSPRGKLLLIFPLAIVILTSYLTFSRAAWAAGLFAAGTYVWLTARGGWAEQKGAALMFSALFILVILLALITVSVGSRLPRTIPADESLRLRFGYWQTAGRMIKARFFLGFGPGTFGSAFPRYKLPGVGETQMAHNCLLQIWAESGVFAFLSFLVSGAAFLWKGLMTVKKLPVNKAKERNFLAGVFSGIVAFSLHSLVDVDLYVPGIAVIAVFFLAAFRARASFLAGESFGKVRPFSRRGRLLFVPGLMVLTAFLLTAVIRPTLAQYHAGVAQRFLDGGDFGRAEEEFKQAIRLNPLSADYHFYLASRIYEKQTKAEGISGQEREKMRKKAIAEYRQAISRNRYLASYHYRLGRLYLDGGEEEIQPAVEAFKQASFYFPSRAFYRQELDRLLAEFDP